MYNTDTESFPVWKDRKTAEGMYAGFLNQEDMNMRKEWGIMKRKCLKASLAAVAALCLAACFTFAAGAEEGNRWGLHHGEGRGRKHYDSFFRSVGDASGFLVRKLCHEYQLRFRRFFPH